MVLSGLKPDPNLGGNDRSLLATRERIAEHLVGMTVAVQGCRVEPIDPLIEGGMDGGSGLCIVHIIAPPETTDGPAA
jgi:hypothetical protein